MSVAALPPPSLQPRMSIPIQKRPMQPRPSTTAVAPRPSQGLKAKPAASPVIVRQPSSASSSTPRSTPAALPPATPVATASGSKDTSSSSGKVFAKPSKDWVLPERAKPGRKVSVEEPDNKRQSQNRLSQRAHRARRTDYIQTLEERLRQYEADEIHSNVRLQEVARALKADNERLKQEVVTLRMDISEMTSQRDTWESERTSYEELVTRLRGELAGLRGGESASPHFVRPAQPHHPPPPISLPTLTPHDRRATMDCPICPDPDPDCPCQQKEVVQPRPTAPLAALHLAVKAMAEQDPCPTPGGDSCGICQTTDDCLCSIIEHHEEEDVKPVIFPTPSPELDLDFGGPPGGDGCGLCTSASFCACKANASSSGSSESPIMGISLSTPCAPTSTYPTPPYSTIAVPLKLRRATSASKPKASIWALDPPSVTPTQKDEAVCSGDPSNCDACRNDTFGKEFCESLFEKAETVPAFKPCTDCPGNCMSIKSLLCSSDSAEGPHHSHPHDHDHAHPELQPALPPLTEIPGSTYTPSAAAETDTMTCDQAWKTLKAHPNSRYASLSLLADVVAGRTVCTGPQTPAPLLPNSHSSFALTKQESGVNANSSGIPSTLIGAGKKRNMAVETSAVRDALRLLDKTTPVNSPGSGRVEIEPENKKRRIE